MLRTTGPAVLITVVRCGIACGRGTLDRPSFLVDLHTKVIHAWYIGVSMHMK